MFCGGSIIFGYRVVNKRVEINEDEANIVRYIFDQYAHGRQAKDILNELTAQGIGRRNKPFPINTFYSILHNPKYIGVANLSDGAYTNIYPPIIPKELFEKVQMILEKNKRGSRSKDTDYLLTRKCICGYCGRNIHAETGTARDGTVRHYYKCDGRKNHHDCQKSVVRKDDLEQLVLQITRDIIGTSENIELIADGVMEIHEKRLHDHSVLNLLLAERDKLQKVVDNIMKAIEQGILTPTTKARMEQTEQKLSDINVQINAEQCKLQSQLKREQVIEYLKHTVWQKPQLMIYTLIQKIVLYDDKIEIYYNYADPMKADASPADEHRLFFSINGSNLLCSVSPNWNYPNTSDSFYFYYSSNAFHPGQRTI